MLTYTADPPRYAHHEDREHEHERDREDDDD
jgi:hypothetical protein